MWFLAINGLIYLIYGFASGRLRERLLPIRPADVIQTVVDTLHFRIAHEDITVYNGVQKLLYIVVILAGVAQVITGLAIWKPVQFSGLISLLGGFQTARVLHFAGMTVMVGFLIVHVALALLVPKTLWAMVSGGPRLQSRGHAEGRPARRKASRVSRVHSACNIPIQRPGPGVVVQSNRLFPTGGQESAKLLIIRGRDRHHRRCQVTLGTSAGTIFGGS